MFVFPPPPPHTYIARSYQSRTRTLDLEAPLPPRDSLERCIADPPPTYERDYPAPEYVECPNARPPPYVYRYAGDQVVLFKDMHNRRFWGVRVTTMITAGILVITAGVIAAGVVAYRSNIGDTQCGVDKECAR
ncbi:hypothetical protein EDC01DRAFT_634342 [Geopyxis carbonaria]|nr:hypothetical protein EDC01DRAFT_634342 [Geopyxis carbonaria]